MIEFQLPTMTCGHCVKTVTQAIQGVDAQAKVDIDLPSHRVRIESAQPEATFRSALEAEGYAEAP
jgi:copper chaperone